MRLTGFVRVFMPIHFLVPMLLTVGSCFVLVAEPAGAADEATTCFDASLPRQRTEIDADLAVPQFDSTLGTLLEVTATGPSLHLDTDAVFENTAQSAGQFAEHMDYLVTITSPGGLASPAPITGTIQRIPMQTLASFDGTLDFLGPSAVSQPSTARDDTAGTTSSTDPAVLAAFTGPGTMPFHLTTAIGETFMGGGGNVQSIINTFGSAVVQVCYRYALPATEVVVQETPPPPPSSPPITPPTPPAALVAARTLPATGGASAPLTVAGVLTLAVGLVLARRFRAPRPRLGA